MSALTGFEVAKLKGVDATSNALRRAILATSLKAIGNRCAAACACSSGKLLNSNSDDVVYLAIGVHGYPGGFRASDRRVNYVEVDGWLDNVRSGKTVVTVDTCFSATSLPSLTSHRQGQSPCHRTFDRQAVERSGRIVMSDGNRCAITHSRPTAKPLNGACKREPKHSAFTQARSADQPPNGACKADKNKNGEGARTFSQTTIAAHKSCKSPKP